MLFPRPARYARFRSVPNTIGSKPTRKTCECLPNPDRPAPRAAFFCALPRIINRLLSSSWQQVRRVRIRASRALRLRRVREIHVRLPEDTDQALDEMAATVGRQPAAQEEQPAPGVRAQRCADVAPVAGKKVCVCASVRIENARTEVAEQTSVPCARECE